MAKAPKAAPKADPKAAKKAAKVQTTLANKAARLTRHVKKHENDKQAASAVGKPRATRKASMTKGNFPSKTKYFDGAGRKVDAPLFRPIVKEKAKDNGFA